MDISEFENKIGIIFKDKNLLKQAFVHRSYLNENRNFPIGHNERLEFLGDAVLELIVTDDLYRRFPDKNEGEMTSLRSALVNANTLYSVADKLGVNDFLFLSRGESKDTGRARLYILANTIESIIGAIYLDQGYEQAQKFVRDSIIPIVEEVISNGNVNDAKSRFQEKAQDKFSITPVYKTIKESGPDHDKKFTVGVYIGDEVIATGEGDSKQDAEQEAAKNGLEKKGWTE
jgi:ribonuclease-3